MNCLIYGAAALDSKESIPYNMAPLSLYVQYVVMCKVTPQKCPLNDI
jgi:hypothetical protein